MRTAIVVPGHSRRGPDGVYRISAACLGLVGEAERIAELTAVEAVIFSGWARAGGAPEAVQMQSAWRGPEVELVVESTASVTAENASRTLPLLVERGIRHAVVVCAPFHVYRTRFFFSRLYRARGVEPEFHVARVATGLRALGWEIAAAAACRRQLRAALVELEGAGP
jgi:uncharacterized SAM-binding protein YcdF (DUF218 family)